MGLMPYDRDETGQRRAGVGTAAFALLLIAGMVLGLAGIAFTSAQLVRDGTRYQALVDAGVIGTGDQVEALLDGALDGSGCMVVDGALVRFDGMTVTTRMPLLGASLTRQGDDLLVTGEGRSLACRVGQDPTSDAFVGFVTRRTTEPPPRRLQWHTPEPVLHAP